MQVDTNKEKRRKESERKNLQQRPDFSLFCLLLPVVIFAAGVDAYAVAAATATATTVAFG